MPLLGTTIEYPILIKFVLGIFFLTGGFVATYYNFYGNAFNSNDPYNHDDIPDVNPVKGQLLAPMIVLLSLGSIFCLVAIIQCICCAGGNCLHREKKYYVVV